MNRFSVVSTNKAVGDTLILVAASKNRSLCENGETPSAFERMARNQGIDCIPGRSYSFQITWYRRQVPVTQGSEKSCKKSDEVIVAVKCMKVHGVKDRNTNAFPDGKHT